MPSLQEGNSEYLSFIFCFSDKKHERVHSHIHTQTRGLWPDLGRQITNHLAVVLLVCSYSGGSEELSDDITQQQLLPGVKYVNTRPPAVM